MSNYVKQLTMVLMTILSVTLAGCGGGSESTPSSVEQTPMICKAPYTVNEAGSGCELILSACNYPEVANEAGLCVMDTGPWVPGANGIDMPVPEYVVQPGEIAIYYALENSEYQGWGLHAWNNVDCNSYSDFEATGGTDWTTPIQPTGIDPNFGAYWVMNIKEQPNCAWFIPHNLDLNEQTIDLMVELATAEQNPTGAFFVLEGHEDIIFPYPRTFDSLVVPGGSTPTCGEGEVLDPETNSCIPDPNVPDVFVPGETQLYLRGSFNGWEAQDAYALSYADNVYTAVAHLEASADAYEFKIADANWSASTSFGAMVDEQDIMLGEAKTLTVTDGQNLKITVSDATNIQFTFDATDPEAPVLTAITVAYDQVMFVKGSMNEWSNTQPMVYEGNGIYTSEYSLDVAEYEFKVADANWTEATNFGAAAGDEQLSLDTPKTLVFGEGIAMNIKMAITVAGTYKFTLDATVPTAPIITVANAIPYGDKVLYLKGSMNGWSTDEGYQFSYADNHYALVKVLPAGDYEFKIADPDWLDGSTLGAVTGEGALSLDQPKTLTLPGDNLTLTVAEDTLLQFDVDATNKNAPILTVTKYVPFQARTMYLKGSMNGWSAADGYAFTATATGIFSLDVTVPVGAYEFKIADTDWLDDSTLGAITGHEAVTLGEANTLTLPGDGNLTIDISEEKVYNFTVDASTPTAPVLTVVGL